MKEKNDVYVSTLLKMAARLMTKRAQSNLKESGVQHGYTPFLMELWKTDGLSQKELHQAIGIEGPSAVRTLDRMERDGFIKRTASHEDRRVTIIRLTNKGVRIKDRVINEAMLLNREALKGIAEKEQAQLKKLLIAIIDNLQG